MKRILALCLAATLVSYIFALPRNLVVVEIGTGTWCQYCPGAAMGADDLISNSHPVAIIENHNGDTYANTYSNARNTYYGITGYPTAEFDGLNPSVGGSNSQSMYGTYLPKVNARMAVASHYTISATGFMDGNNINIQAVVSKPEADTNTNVVLHCAITESHINQSWQGQNHLNFVNRLMLPNQNGTAVSLSTGGTQTVNLTGNFQSAWNINTCEVVLFLQNTSTKEVLQGVKYTLPGLLGVNPVSVDQLSFPDTYVTGTSQLSFDIHNFFGSSVAGSLSSNNPAFTLQQNNFTIAAYQSVSISVDFNPTAAQNYSGNLSITSNLPGYNNVTIPLSGTGFTNAPPQATNVTVLGPPVVFQILSVDYDFSDPDGNSEGTSLFQWMRIIGGTPELIDNATNAEYATQVEDMGWQVACRVTPVDQFGMPGIPVTSAYSFPIEELPSPRNLTGYVEPPNNVVLAWQKPMYFDTRGFIGYRIYRDEASLTNIMDVNTLTFTDNSVPDGNHSYYIVAIFSNPLNFSNPSNTITIYVSVANEDELAPSVESVSVYPNPFSGIASFKITGKASKPVSIVIFNLKGQLVCTLHEVLSSEGNAVLEWDGRDSKGSQLESGIYLFRAQGEGFASSGKLVLSH
jgi:hypothetical protein